jgi:dipeptide/tripeptide permease
MKGSLSFFKNKKRRIFMMRTPLMKTVGMAVWFLTALCAMYVGAVAWGYDFLAHPSLAHFRMPLVYIFGIAGVVSMVMFLMAVLGKHGCCDSDVC